MGELAPGIGGDYKIPSFSQGVDAANIIFRKNSLITKLAAYSRIFFRIYFCMQVYPAVVARFQILLVTYLFQSDRRTVHDRNTPWNQSFNYVECLIAIFCQVNLISLCFKRIDSLIEVFL